MVQQYISVKTSDLSGVELVDGGGDTISFSVGRNSYAIDLTNEEVGAFYDALKPFTDAARKGGDVTSTRTARSTTPKQDLAAVRDWANKNGFQVSTRGRVPANVLEAYHAAH